MEIVKKGNIECNVEPDAVTDLGIKNQMIVVTIPEVVLKGIVHDLNNALCVPNELLPVIREKISLCNKDEVFDILDEIGLATGHAIKIAKQLGCLSGNNHSIKKKVDVINLVRDAGRVGLSGSRIHLEVNAREKTLIVECDEAGLFRVLVNFLLNARQSINGGNGVVRLNIENTVVDQRSNLPLQDGDYVRISIADNGEGISPENLKRVFKPGFTTKSNGNGIGLATSAQIIREHDGHIEVKSELGVGTTFEIFLPVAREEKRREEKRNF